MINDTIFYTILGSNSDQFHYNILCSKGTVFLFYYIILHIDINVKYLI